ncbi:CPBP family intramembrane glutamic endopeptidase [Streptomyces sp. ISL-86]|uniref:CPBP family intramembrane glutamic endopeptidase n=1 Tax=Streptomyces sp. ISL-86 TaxID=2819187 RepID=UPI001BED2BE6|nr:CPBP family intramembrane glutamic endopeptidase [Streptomyces sp. ISL-86]MBT2455552.1 CPBP family intramembrane metalloprotease [Streptomyces sp. ISL-86]
MGRLLLVVAVLPVFALLLAAVVAVRMRYGPAAPGGSGPRRAVERTAPVLYAGTVAAVALLAAALTGLDPHELGLWPEQPIAADVAWTLGATVLGAVVAGTAGYVGELALSQRAVNRATLPAAVAVSGEVPGEAVGMRAAGAWARSPRALLALGLVTAAAEEVLFRGYLLEGLRDAVPLWAALVLQAVLFGVHHASFGLRAVPAKTVHGLVWGGLAVAAGSLLPALTAHLVFQLLACRRMARHGGPDTSEGGSGDDGAHGPAAVRRPPVAG